jgi:hypothetical protein
VYHYEGSVVLNTSIELKGDTKKARRMCIIHGDEIHIRVINDSRCSMIYTLYTQLREKHSDMYKIFQAALVLSAFTVR